MDKKSPWASKTLWVNAIALVATVSALMGFDLGLTPERQAEIVAVVLPVVNFILRFVTDKAVK